MNMPRALPKALYKQIITLCDRGNVLAGQAKYVEARKVFSDALRLVPEPKIDWEATTWIISSLGDAWFQDQNFDMARRAFEDAVRCPGGLGNTFIHLRLGEIFYELQDHKRAADELTRAYMAGGRDAFKDEDPKYFRLLEQVLKPPLGHDHLP